MIHTVHPRHIIDIEELYSASGVVVVAIIVVVYSSMYYVRPRSISYVHTSAGISLSGIR